MGTWKIESIAFSFIPKINPEIRNSIILIIINIYSFITLNNKTLNIKTMEITIYALKRKYIKYTKSGIEYSIILTETIGEKIFKPISNNDIIIKNIMVLLNMICLKSSLKYICFN